MQGPALPGVMLRNANGTKLSTSPDRIALFLQPRVFSLSWLVSEAHHVESFAEMGIVAA